MHCNSRTEEKWDGGECAAAVNVTVQMGTWQILAGFFCNLLSHLNVDVSHLDVEVIIGKEDSKSQCTWTVIG